ncbi:MAG: ATP-binding cassette domain-containing protein, partial [Brachybacterium sp.]|nr:ATP-binding cassette domain-containing protein [Brachybacterium sp.]
MTDADEVDFEVDKDELDNTPVVEIPDERGAKQPPVREVKAVKGISFAARHGEAIGIIGINGSGKSTLLRAIAGLIPPVAGSVHVAGNPALLGVNAVLMKDLTGERNIMIGALALGLS